MIVGAAVVPTAPLLVQGLSGFLPSGLAEVAAAVGKVLTALPPHDIQVLATATSAPGHPAPTLRASLGGIGRPDFVVERSVETSLAAHLQGAGLAPAAADAGALDLAVLVHLLGTSPADVVALTATGATIGEFRTAAARLARLAEDSRRFVLVVAGDLSAGLDARAPLHHVNGAQAWDDRGVAAVRSGDAAQLAALGPAEAVRVGARGWASLATLVATCDLLGVLPQVDLYAAPRGVGYLVAHAADGKR